MSEASSTRGMKLDSLLEASDTKFDLLLFLCVIQNALLHPTRADRARKLIELLETNPDSDFDKFIKALRDYSQGHVADKLQNVADLPHPVENIDMDQ